VSAAELAGVPIRVLREKVGSLKDKRHAIVSTLDFLFTGF
jgi:toxin CcdB